MSLLYLIRHGRIADEPADPADPELGATGLQQARDAARQMQARLPGPLPILSSPMRRCRETAAPLAELWRVQPTVEPRVIEVPSPVAGAARQLWLKQALAASWPELEQQDPTGQIAAWRAGVREALLAQRGDVVIVSHFVPINVIVGLALGQERVTCFRPDNASVTLVETGADGIRLVELGREMGTRVL
jgi:broad specificity phosphatase PhoE